MESYSVLHLRKSQGLYGAERVILALSEECKKIGIYTIVGCISDKRNLHTEIIDAAKLQNLSTQIIPCRSRLDFNTIK